MHAMRRRAYMDKYTDCEQGHTKERITGKTDDEFVANVKKHLGMIHKDMPMPSREDILKMAKTS
jgi:hypothetical protein